MATAEASVAAVEPVGVTVPRGFRAAGVHGGIKRRKPDVALVVSDRPAVAAGMFTTNRLKAAPVRYSERVVARGVARAVVINSGNANACTGERGWRDAVAMAEATAAALGIAPEEVLVASTGVIGVPLPMAAVRRGIALAAAALGRERGAAAAEAIRTTDAFSKTASAVATLAEGQVRVGGMAKGAGMIHPRLATTLAVVTTDAAVAPAAWQALLRRAVDVSFHAITVDGDTSTNDSVFALANGAAGVAPRTPADWAAFEAAVVEVLQRLARLVVRDGEGAERLALVRVRGAASDAEARAAAEAVATSLLVKTMLHGGEPNWGRVAAALGRAGVAIEEGRLAIDFGEVPVVRGGVGVEGVAAAAAAALRREEVTIAIDLGLGAGCAEIWTCDLGHRYVELNGRYLT